RQDDPEPQEELESTGKPAENPTEKPPEKLRERLEVKPKRKKRSTAANWNPLIGAVVATVTMITVTILVFQLLPRYQQIGDALLTDPPFPIGFDGWQQEGFVELDPTSPDHVVLENDDPAGRAFLRRVIPLPPGPSLVLLRADVETERVRSGTELWQRARVYLARLDADGDPPWSEPHHLFRLRGNKSPRRFTQIFEMPDQVSQALLSINLTNATGRMTVGNLELSVVEEQATFRMVKFALIGAWGLLLLAVAVATFRSIPSMEIRLWLGGMAGLFLVALLLPGEIRNQLLAGLPLLSSLGISDPDVIGHAVVFAIMAGLVRWGRPKDPFWLHVALWVLVGIATEVLQLFTLGREASVVDFAVDMGGMLLGLTLAEFLPSVFSDSTTAQRSHPMSG
ncbi:MAG: VanZ family protein, partial [Geminicoccaceae bacterium]